MPILSYPEADTPPPLRAQVLALQDEAWPPGDVPSSGPSHDPGLDPLSMLLTDEHGTVLAALAILRKDLTHAGHRLRAGGLSTVVTLRAERGQGHGRRLVGAARESMASYGIDLGLFTCDRPLRAFYERAGWRELPGAVVVGGTPDAPFPSDGAGFDKVTMAAFFTPAARAARPSLRGARIALYPGTVDRLW
ncbi:GNAT family N-acetyltransferase [Streptomyces sp. NPDC006711]|uniref:GNAT family N-acetyltransferase n=1 Tax=Streptomyces sp. NPDC006711 TaxID=3364762 RepID=UPI00369D2487